MNLVSTFLAIAIVKTSRVQKFFGETIFREKKKKLKNKFLLLK